MRQFIAIGLLCIATLPFLVKSGLVMHYWFNYAYYAEVLCENKDKPEMHCNGSCALSKELAKAETAKQLADTKIPELNKLNVSLFIPSQLTECSFGDALTTTYFNATNFNLPTIWKVDNIFHPPALV